MSSCGVGGEGGVSGSASGVLSMRSDETAIDGASLEAVLGTMGAQSADWEGGGVGVGGGWFSVKFGFNSSLKAPTSTETVSSDSSGDGVAAQEVNGESGVGTEAVTTGSWMALSMTPNGAAESEAMSIFKGRSCCCSELAEIPKVETLLSEGERENGKCGIAHYGHFKIRNETKPKIETPNTYNCGSSTFKSEKG